ncbi:FHA domain-containing protein [Mycobacterium sp. IDR2000157661]|uniref:FHA domain-containing protein n=1 Tax=Mycobacterium sp. IDR2000157661 TaxID=2867005 RepID=UPI001EEB07D4|nr:FHA domain-containing protein [Mycobacterium sp. IDR2000157661]
MNVDSDALNVWSALYALVVAADTAPGDKLGDALAGSVASWASAQGADVEFGILAPASDGYAVILRGAVAVTVYDADAPEILHGATPPAPPRRVVRPVTRRVALYVVEQDGSTATVPTERGIGSLVEGVAQGSGAVVWPEEVRFPVASPAEPIPPAVPDSRHPVDLVPPKVFETFKPDDQPPPRRAPLPVRRRAEAKRQPPPRTRERGVGGIICARRHFNDPRVSFCRLCGLRMNQTKEIIFGERPPLGFLVLDDGTTIVLNSDLVIGRDPNISSPAGSSATPIQLVDPAGELSRAHIAIRLIDWDVSVVDLNSTNGTRVKQANEDLWRRIAPQRPHLLKPGAEVQIGGRRITFESPAAHI